MTEKLKQKIKEEVEKLPKESREAINASGWENISEEIGAKYLLPENKINNLQTEIFLFLIGLIPPNLFQDDIEENVDIGKEEIGKILAEITQKIFAPINNKVIETIKKNNKSGNANYEQNLNFILSGGNYCSFLSKRNDIINTTPDVPLVRGNDSPRLDKGEAGRGFKK